MTACQIIEIKRHEVVRTHIVDEPAETCHGEDLPLKGTHAQVDQGLVHDGNLPLVHLIRPHGHCSRVNAMVVGVPSSALVRVMLVRTVSIGPVVEADFGEVLLVVYVRLGCHSVPEV